MTTIPVNISANVGIASGAPNNTETTAQYLTQLQQSLNGFTGSTAAALNYLLQTAASAPGERLFFSSILEVPSAGWKPPGTSGYVMGAMSTSPFVSANGGGNPPVNFTPSVTGRVAVIALMPWTPVALAAGNINSVNAILNFGTGSTAYVQGTAGPTGTQVGLGSVIEQSVGDTLRLPVFSLAPMALLSGLSTTTQYWLDIGFSYSTSSSGNFGSLGGGIMFVIEC